MGVVQFEAVKLVIRKPKSARDGSTQHGQKSRACSAAFHRYSTELGTEGALGAGLMPEAHALVT